MRSRYGRTAASADVHVPHSALAFNVGEADMFSFGVGNKGTCGLGRATSPVRLFGILSKLRCRISIGLTFEFAFSRKVMKIGRRNSLWLKGTSPFPFPDRHKYLNCTHLRSGWGSLNSLPSGPTPFQLCPLVFEMQNKFPWRRLCGLLVGGSGAVRPEGSRLFWTLFWPCLYFPLLHSFHWLSGWLQRSIFWHWKLMHWVMN